MRLVNDVDEECSQSAALKWNGMSKYSQEILILPFTLLHKL